MLDLGNRLKDNNVTMENLSLGETGSHYSNIFQSLTDRWCNKSQNTDVRFIVLILI